MKKKIPVRSATGSDLASGIRDTQRRRPRGFWNICSVREEGWFSDMKRVRQYKGILAAAAAYYSVHEGAHLLCAVLLGAFKQIRFMGIGMQIDVYAERMIDGQMALFCVAGASATLFAGIMLAALAGKISRIKSKLLRAAMYYITIAFLLLDPLYLSILCGFFGGGDMNGISLIFPEWAVRIAFAGLLIINGWIFWKRVLPVYKESFSNEHEI